MEKMKKLTMRVCMLTILLALTACSKDNDSYPENNSSPSLNDDLKEDIAAMEGNYKGVWLLNGRETSADNFFEFHLQKSAYINHQSIEEFWGEYNKKTSYVHFYTNQNAPKSQYKYKYPYIEYLEFPWTPVIKQIFPDIDIAYFTNELAWGGSYNQEEKLLFSISHEAEQSGDKSLKSDALSLVGYSDNMIYYERRYGIETGYTRFLIMVTTKDDNYFAIVLDLVNATSTVSLDLSSKTLICAFHIKQVEIIDKEGNNTIKTLNPEIKLTFTSTEKIY